MANAGTIFVITGPSGVGKGTLIEEVRRRMPELELSISATTRPPRPGEEHGREYFFLNHDEFEGHAGDGNFLEHAAYSGNRYGTLRSEVEKRLAEGKSVLLEIELQGARLVREAAPDAELIFIAPPDFESLRKRLEGRGTDDAESIAERLATAEIEMAARGEFAHVVVNDDLERAADELEAVLRGALTID